MKLKMSSSERIKRRYILMEGDKKDIEGAILDYIGILGWAKATPVFVDMKNGSKQVLSIDRKEIDNVRAAIELSGRKIKIIKVSGTIKGLGKI